MRRTQSIWLSAAALTALLAAGGLTACGSSDSSARTDVAYCDAVHRNLAELNSPSIATAVDIDRTVKMYQAVASSAPLAVEKEWDILVLAYQTASTVVPGDPVSMQKAADTIRSSQPAATTVADYTSRLCGATIGTAAPPTPASTAPTSSTHGKP
ncbi:MAG: hypothetical protein ABIQ39_14975 [Ilumatobacteraceae bacterium]